MMRLLLACALVCGAILAPSADAAVSLQEVGYVQSAIFVAQPPGDSHHLFIPTRDGKIMLITDGGTPTTYLDLRSRVAVGGDGGLMSMAFAPDYATSGKFYVFYRGVAGDFGGNEGDLHVTEYTDPNRSDAVEGETAPRSVLLTPHDGSGRHDGGQIQFGPDGLLYISVGDGGGNPVGRDPTHNGQNLDDTPRTVPVYDPAHPDDPPLYINHHPWLGKILRIDPNGAADGDYSIPAGSGQPFTTGMPEVTAWPEIFAYGLRNPWRFSFDKQTNDFVMGDVGEDTNEELDYVPAADFKPGLNFGWSAREGLDPFDGTATLLPGTTETKPVYQYKHTSPSCGGAIIGGYVVRDASSALNGQYVFADFCKASLRATCLQTPAVSSVRDLGLSVDNITSLGEDNAGNIYVVQAVGTVSRLVATGDEGSCAATPGPSPPSAVAKASLSFSRRQPVGRRGYLKVSATCDGPCVLAARAKFARKGVKRALSSKVLRKSVAANRRTTLKIKLSASARKALRRAAKAKRRTTATVTVTLSAGTSPKPVKITVSG